MASRTRSWRKARRSPDSLSRPASTAAASAGTSCAGLRPASSASSANENVEPRIEATRSRFNASSGSRLSRRRNVRRKVGGSDAGGPRPARPARRSPPRRRAPAPARSRTAGFPPAPCHLLEQPRAGRKTDDLAGQIEPPPRSSTARGPHAQRPARAGRRRPGRRPRHGIHCAPSRTTPTADGSGGGRWSAAARRVNGSAHCRSSTTTATGTVEASSSKTSTTASTISHPSSAIPAPCTTRPAGPASPQQAGELGTRRIGCAPLDLQGLAQGPQGTVPLELVARARENPKPPPPGERQRFGDQTGLADPSLALDAARSVPVPSPHPRRRRAGRPARPPGRPTGPETRLRPLPCRDHRGHTNRPPTTSVETS